uniref:ATP-dependent Clp protease proteolytic subunit n=2 Tax=Lecanorchis TaxID=112165 RepID=A0A6G7KVM2_9ASPA|nr:clp protease proteolytic subunit [Lecanorchis kiusiana]YP_009747733.1 clp protease proteolytic subunit [Lecanorchis japonica]QII89389.1 clp protease proteolytic subunit [Lecanorchis kiusiana]QII89413.1 clp protease proteolytic subunit [Lecanorchis japonica]
MPVGVPKVPFRFPGEEDAVWTDLYNRLYRDRFLFLGQELDTEISNQLVGLIVYLSIEDATRDHYLFINCPGGWILPGIALYDTMQWVPPDVHTIGIGLVASMGSLILVGGEMTKRIALPYARVMIHQPASAFCEDETEEFFLEIDQILYLRQAVLEIYIEKTRVHPWIIAEDLERDVFMSATEAQAHGVVDLVGFEDENNGDSLSILSI